MWAVLEKGDQPGTYTAMNRFMEMLAGKEGGIPAWSAQTLFDFGVDLVPGEYHDAALHNPLRSVEDFDYAQGQPLWLGDGAYMLDEVWERPAPRRGSVR